VSAVLLDDILARVEALPPLPDTTRQLAGVLSDPASSLADVVGIIRYDQSLTVEVLRLCNSAYFGLSRRVETLDDAVRLLGTAKVVQLVFAAHARATLARPQPGYGLPAGALWRHSVGVALAGQRLGARMNPAVSNGQAGLLFTAGLLHDVGKVVLSEYVGQQYTEICQQVTEQHCTFAQAETAVLGFAHAEIGGRLAERWNLPAAIVRCVRHHHEPEALAEPDLLVDAVHVADALGTMLGIGGGDDGLCYRGSVAVLTRYTLTEPELEAVGAEVVAELKTVQAMFA
jgi:HD-like signal output (HDOD) protein